MSIEKKGQEFDRGDLARAINEKHGTPEATVHYILEQFAGILPDVLREHGRVELPGLGVFTLGPKYRKTESGFEATGKHKVRFRPAEDLNRAVGIE